MPRPLVAVFQEFANLNFTPAAADLNTCIAAVARQVKDYSSAAPLNTRVSGEYLREEMVVSPPGLLLGAQLESAVVTVVGPEVQILYVDVAAVSGTNSITVATTTGIQVGDEVVIAGAADPVTVVEVDGNMVRVDLPSALVGGAKVSVADLARGVILEPDTVEGWFTMSDPTSVSTGTPTGLAVGDLVYVNGTSFGEVNRLDATSFGITETLKKYDGSEYALNEPINKVLVTRKFAGAFEVSADDVSFSASDRTVTIAEGALLANDDVLGRAEEVHVGFVARRTDLARFFDVNSAADAEQLVGAPDPRNPLGLGVWVALQNTGTKVVAYGVTADSISAFAEFQKLVAPRQDVYCVVPVSTNPTTQMTVVAAMKAKFAQMADPYYALEKGVPQRFKMVVAGGFAIQDPKVVALGSNATSESYGGSYKITSADAKFYTNGVRVGDRLGDGLVEAVISNQQLIATHAATGAIEVLRDLDTEGRFAELREVPKGLASKRVVMLLGDTVTIPAVSTVPQSAAYLGCAVGGMIAGLPPHSGITNLYIAGITDIAGTHTDFDEPQLSALSDAGWCVFIEDAPTAAPYCIHGVTTDPSALEFAEIMSVKNFDYVSSVMSAGLNSFIGTWNINPETLLMLRASLGSSLAALKARKLPKLGAPVISGGITQLGLSTISADRLEIYVELQMPKSLNTIGLHLVSV